MKALRLPTPHLGRFWFATGFRAALRGSCSPKRSRADGGAARAWAVWSAGGPVPAGVRVDGVGSHRFPGDPSRAFALLKDPGRISGPSPKRSHRCCPRAQHDEGFSGHMISRLPQGFSTRCLRFARDVAAARARLASGWLVSLCRERVELSGSRRKVSERSHVVLLSRAYPVASWAHTIRTQLRSGLPWAVSARLRGAQWDDMADLQTTVADDDTLDDELQDRLLVGERRLVQAGVNAITKRLQAGANGLGLEALATKVIALLLLALQGQALVSQMVAPLRHLGQGHRAGLVGVQ